MEETGPVRFPGNYLDPSAQEFWPAQNAVFQPRIPFFSPPPSQVYYPYAAPLTVSFSGGGSGGVPQFHTAVPVPVPLPTPVPPPSSTAYVTVPMMVLPQPTLPPPSSVGTRALVLTSVPFDVSEYGLKEELEAFGEVRWVQMERIDEGIVTVHFYDLRHAERALKEIRDHHMQLQQSEPGEANACAPLYRPERGLISGRAVWAYFIIPASDTLPDGNNQGTVVVFNLDPGVPSSTLKDIFQAYGPVKELRETPLKKHQRFVEFYDVRDAAKALLEMNGREINGKQVVIEFSRPGGFSRKYFNANNANNVNKPFKACTRNNISFSTRKYSPPPPSPPPHRFSGRYTPNIPPRSILSRSQSPSKKVVSDSNKGNPNENNKGTGSVETTVVGGGAVKKSSVKKNQNNHPTQRSNTNNGFKQQQQCSKGRAWKGKHGRKFDPRFLISEEAMVESNCQDSRTTVMIKNIPNKYSQKLLLNMLDNHCIHCNEQIVDAGDDQPLSSYDFVYLPIDFNNKCNVGYGFVNMTSPQATWRLYKAFHHQHWEVFNSRKICEVTYARVQGLQALKEHFRNSKFPCEMEHYLPVVFAPPRDGKQLTEPHPVAGEKQQSSGPSPKSNEELDDDDEDEFHGGAANSCRDENNIASANHSNYCIESVEQQEEIKVLGNSVSKRLNGGEAILGYD